MGCVCGGCGCVTALHFRRREPQACKAGATGHRRGGNGAQELFGRFSSPLPRCTHFCMDSARLQRFQFFFTPRQLLLEQTEQKPEHPTRSTGTVPGGWGTPGARTAGARCCGGDFCALSMREPQVWCRGRRGPLGAPRKAVSQLGSCGRALAGGCETFGSPQRWERRTPK